MTTGGSPITFRFSRQILNSRSWRRGSPAGTRLAISAGGRRLDDDRFAGIEHGGGAAFECLDTAVLASHGILADVFLLLCLLFGGFACLVFLLRRPPMVGAATADAH